MHMFSGEILNESVQFIVTECIYDANKSIVSALPLPCIILNENRSTKTGEAWERGYGTYMKHTSDSYLSCYVGCGILQRFLQHFIPHLQYPFLVPT